MWKLKFELFILNISSEHLAFKCLKNLKLYLYAVSQALKKNVPQK